MIVKKISLDNINNSINSTEKLIITIGAFDGLHLGHQRLLEELKNAKEKDKTFKTAVLTFENHPDFYLNKRDDRLIIANNKTKYAKFSACDIDYCFLLDKEILLLTYQEFHSKILDKLNVNKIYVGSEFCYGKNALGNVYTLMEKYNVKTFLIKKENGKKISSSDILLLLEKGDIIEANKLLGYNYTIDVISYDILSLTYGNKIIKCILDNCIIPLGMYQSKLLINDVVEKNYCINIDYDNSINKYYFNIKIENNINELDKLKIEIIKKI